MTFHLFGSPDEKLRLKSYTSTSRGEKMTIRIELETADHFEFGYVLKELGKVQKGQRAKPEKPQPKARREDMP